MTPNRDEALCRMAPTLYRDRRGNRQRTGMWKGFQVGDGWYRILVQLSKQIERLIQGMPARCECGHDLGFHYDRRNDCDACPSEICRRFREDRPHAIEVKEAFGELVFDLTWTTPDMRKLIEAAVVESRKTCEVCGAEGKRRQKGLLRTTCNTCFRSGKTTDEPTEVRPSGIYVPGRDPEPSDAELAASLLRNQIEEAAIAARSPWSVDRGTSTSAFATAAPFTFTAANAHLEDNEDHLESLLAAPEEDDDDDNDDDDDEAEEPRLRSNNSDLVRATECAGHEHECYTHRCSTYHCCVVHCPQCRVGHAECSEEEVPF